VGAVAARVAARVDAPRAGRERAQVGHHHARHHGLRCPSAVAEKEGRGEDFGLLLRSAQRRVVRASPRRDGLRRCAEHGTKEARAAVAVTAKARRALQHEATQKKHSAQLTAS
jgi:hypothetical protein